MSSLSITAEKMNLVDKIKEYEEEIESIVDYERTSMYELKIIDPADIINISKKIKPSPYHKMVEHKYKNYMPFDRLVYYYYLNSLAENIELSDNFVKSILLYEGSMSTTQLKFLICDLSYIQKGYSYTVMPKSGELTLNLVLIELCKKLCLLLYIIEVKQMTLEEIKVVKMLIELFEKNQLFLAKML
jgi:hypothetical protein